VYISCTEMFHVWGTCSVWIVLLASKFRRVLVRRKVLECVSHPYPTVTGWASVLGPARSWMVGSCVSYRHDEMILPTAFDVVAAAVVGAFCCRA
jgi:hypothetical protein